MASIRSGSDSAQRLRKERSHTFYLAPSNWRGNLGPLIFAALLTLLAMLATCTEIVHSAMPWERSLTRATN